tara:strand:+ start:8432 stop:9796 length:1365 start_codon:yes stop_codon:yes gene_type:complete
MTTKVTLTTLSGLSNETTAITSINNNFNAIAEQLDLLLSRDGESPNTLTADLDINSNRIRNLPDSVNNDEPLTHRQALIQFPKIDIAVENIDNINAVADNYPNISVVATDIDNVNTLAGLSVEVQALGAIAPGLTNINNELTKVTAVADDLALGSSSLILQATAAAVSAAASETTAANKASEASVSATEAAASATNAATSETNAAQSAVDATTALSGLQAQIDILSYTNPTISVDITTPTNETQEDGVTINDVTISVNGSFNSGYSPALIEARQKSGSWVDVTSQMTINSGTVSGSVSYTSLNLNTSSTLNNRTFEARITDAVSGSLGGNTVESNEDVLDFRPRIFWSDGTEAAPTNSATVRALSNSSLVNSLNLFLSPPPGTGDRTIYFAFPQSFVTGGQVTVTSNNALASTILTTDSRFSTISVNDAGGNASNYWLFALVVNDSVVNVRIEN